VRRLRPLKWALTAHTEMPDLPSRRAGFLQIEAERGFHSDVETLHYATSRFTSAGKQHVTLVGIPRNHVLLFEQSSAPQSSSHSVFPSASPRCNRRRKNRPTACSP